MTVFRNGHVGIGTNEPSAKIHLSGIGTTTQFILENKASNILVRLSNDGGTSGAYIGTSTNHTFSLVSNNTVRAVVTSNGTIDVKNNLTVQNGKGIVRSGDGTQQKKLTSSVTVSGAFNAGETKTFGITWSEPFGNTPDAFVGNVFSGTGGWAELIMTIAEASPTGAILYVYNPRNAAVNPNFSIRVVAIGQQ